MKCEKKCLLNYAMSNVMILYGMENVQNVYFFGNGNFIKSDPFLKEQVRGNKQTKLQTLK